MEKNELLKIIRKYVYKDGDILVMYSNRTPSKIADEILALQPIEQPSQPEKIIKALSGEPIIDITTVTSTTYEQPAPEIDLRGELIQFLSETTKIALPKGYGCIDLVDEYLKTMNKK